MNYLLLFEDALTLLHPLNSSTRSQQSTHQDSVFFVSLFLTAGEQSCENSVNVCQIIYMAFHIISYLIFLPEIGI